jgi:outer membrane receptor protein involved in Fe transport
VKPGVQRKPASFRVRFWLPSACVLGCGAAQLPALAGDDSTKLDIVQVTATRGALSSRDVPQGVTVVDREQLRGHQPRTVVDHLRGEPGTFVQQTTPGQGIPIIRGLKGSEVLHVVDGFRLNNAIFRNAPNQYLALVDAWNLERIEVVRGPMSTLYGGDAMGGVAQFLSRAPRFEGSALQTRGKASLQWSSADSREAAQIEGEFGNDRWLTQLGVTWQDVGELRVGGGDTLPFTDYRTQGAHGRFVVNTSEDQQLTVQVQLTRQPSTSRYDALVPGFGQTRPDSSELEFEPQERMFGQVRFTSQRPLAFADAMDLQLGFQRIVDDRVSRDYQSPNRETERNSSSMYGAIGHLSKHLGERHHLSYGFELYHDTVDSSRLRTDIGTDVITVRPSRFPDGSTMRWLGIYVADLWSPHDRLDLTAGARFTRYDIELPPAINDIGVHLEPEDFSASAGIVFRVTGNLNVVANVGRGFRPPNVFDLGTFGARGNRFSIPNPALSPESVITYDTGLKYGTGNLNAELMVFRSDYRDKITQVLTGEVDSSGRIIVQSRNATKLTLEGVEAGAWWQIGEITRLRATATWTRGEEELGPLVYPADRIPPLYGKLLAEFRVTERWRIEPSMYWASSQDRLSPRDVVDPRINPEGTAGWTTFGLRANWRPTSEFDLSLGVDNISDRRFREHGSGFDSAGRNAYASLQWSF